MKVPAFLGSSFAFIGGYAAVVAVGATYGLDQAHSLPYACLGVFFAGMTAYYSAAVWVGSDDYNPLTTDATGGTYAAPLWAAIMARVHVLTGNTKDKDIITKSARSLGLVRAESCAVSGMKPTRACRASGFGVNVDYYLSGTEPTAECNMPRANGKLYIPEGHPLRNALEVDDLKEYFENVLVDE